MHAHTTICQTGDIAVYYHGWIYQFRIHLLLSLGYIMYVLPREACIVQSRNITGHQSSDACQKLYPFELPEPDISHNNDVIMSTIASQITSITIVYSTVYSGADQRNHQSFASLAFVWGIHRGPVNSPHKGQVTRKCFYLMTSSCYRIFLHLEYWLCWYSCSEKCTRNVQVCKDGVIDR